MSNPPVNTPDIRPAGSGDVETLVAFNRAMAWETERKELPADTVRAGVRSLLARPAYGFYALADVAGEAAGALMVTYEWSDWRNGLFWWIQSVYVKPAFRRRGVYRALYAHVRARAARTPGTCGLRLYVERDNAPARSTYAALGMARTPYVVYEELLAPASQGGGE